jgi:HK97 family phage major capsid protein
MDKIRDRFLALNLEPQDGGVLTNPQPVSPRASTYRFSVASEEPVNMGGFREILSHAQGAIDLSRVDGMNHLWQHGNDRIGKLPLGKVESWEVKNKKSYVTVRPTNEDYAKPFWRQVDDGILTNVSIRYEVLSDRQIDNNTVMVDKWQPVHTTSCVDPADHTVGYDRSLGEPASYKSNVNINQFPGGDMEETIIDKKELIKAESLRQREIRAAGESFTKLFDNPRFTELAETFIESDRSVDESRALFSKEIEKMPKERTISSPIQAINPSVGLSQREVKQYSIFRAIEAWRNKDWSKASFEREISQEITDKCGIAPQGFYVPYGDLTIDMRALPSHIRRTMERAPYAVGTPASAGVLVPTTLDTANFIEVLRNTAKVFQMGVRLLPDLVGNIDIPRQTGVSTAYWLTTENQGVTDTLSGIATFDLVSFRPKTLGAKAIITRSMRMQTSMDIEMLVRMDIIKQIALEIDRVVINGSGATGQPMGILNTTGIGAVQIGANGGPITYDAIVDLETAVATANADQNALAYMTNAKVVGALKKLKSTTGEYLWNGSDAGLTAGTPGSLNGYNVWRSNQVPANKTKGTGTGLSCIIYGDWSQVYFAQWGVLDLLPNELGAGYDSGAIELRALQTCDMQLGHKESFSACTDIVA